MYALRGMVFCSMKMQYFREINVIYLSNCRFHEISVEKYYQRNSIADNLLSVENIS